MSAKDEILRRVRDAVGPDAVAPDVPREYRGVSPGAGGRRVERFVQRVEDYRAVVHRTDEAGITAAVAAGLAGATRVVLPAGLDRSWVPDSCDAVVDRDLSPSELDAVDAVVTASTVSIAETGTIVLDGAPDQGRRAITLVPDRHVCIVRANQIVDDVPSALARLDPARPQTWISGPSATSDIELNRVEGVHGPRSLVVVVVESRSGE